MKKEIKYTSSKLRRNRWEAASRIFENTDPGASEAPHDKIAFYRTKIADEKYIEYATQRIALDLVDSMTKWDPQ